jgi:catalase
MPQKQLAQEYPPAGEQEVTLRLADRLKAKVVRENPPGSLRRDAHAKMHGLVKAEFIVEPNLPPELRVGVFKEPRTFQAWIRYSNQHSLLRADIKPDLRGMAIKLMGVEGEKLLEAEKHEKTQDFILCSHPAFFTSDVQEFDDLIVALTGSTPGMIWYFLTHWKMDWILFKAMKKFANPLQMRYWSATPYLFGAGKAIKYSAIPHLGQLDTIPENPDHDYLRYALASTVRKGSVSFDFAVQLQVDADKMLIEDTAQTWSEEVSPFRKVATIIIPQQECDSDMQRAFGENMSLNPWHSLPEHRPLGGTNRARKFIYEFISKFRHEQNQTPRKEPTSWDIATGATPASTRMLEPQAEEA